MSTLMLILVVTLIVFVVPAVTFVVIFWAVLRQVQSLELHEPLRSRMVGDTFARRERDGGAA